MNDNNIHTLVSQIQSQPRRQQMQQQQQAEGIPNFLDSKDIGKSMSVQEIHSFVRGERRKNGAEPLDDDSKR
jgi:hypothetical protein